MRARYHGEQPTNSISNKKDFILNVDRGLRTEANRRFVFMFPALAADASKRLPEGIETIRALKILGKGMASAPSNAESNIPAAYTYFGQFVDHDITNTQFLDFDANTVFQQDNFLPFSSEQIINEIVNRRTPEVDLDSIYGEPAASSAVNPNGSMKLSEVSVAPFGTIPTASRDHDLPRLDMETKPLDQQTEKDKDEDRKAIIGDERNDENLLVGQLHVAFLRSHNALIERGLSAAEAKKALLRRYQWAILDDFLRRVCDPEVMADVMANGATIWKLPEDEDLSVPLEFAGAAYRFGHSMVRSKYNHNQTFENEDFVNFFTFTALSGQINPPDFPNVQFETLPDNWIIDWARFFSPLDQPQSAGLNPARRIDTHITPELGELPNNIGEVFPNVMAHLATRNLLRGYVLGLPTGQAIAEAAGIQPLSAEQILVEVPEDAKASFVAASLHIFTPLWFYVLAEASVMAGGQHLGALGSRIVAETLWVLVSRSPESVVRNPPTSQELATGEFSLRGIVKIGIDSKLSVDEPTGVTV